MCKIFVNVNGEVVHPSSRVIVSAEDVVNSNVYVSLCKLPLRDPDSFVPSLEAYMFVCKSGKI